MPSRKAKTAGGTYSMDLAAYVAGLEPSLVRRWIFGDKKGSPVLMAASGRDGTASFLDVMELMAVRNIRRVRKIPLQRIREAVNVAFREYGITHPFAREHKTYLFGDDIAIEVGGALVQVTGRGKHQNLMEPILEEYLERVVFDKASGLAERYVAMTRGKFSVELNPRVGLGFPMLQPIGCSVSSLVYNVETEGSVSRAARTLEVPDQAVQLAVEYDRDRRRSVLERAA